MSRSSSNKRQPAGQGRGRTPAPGKGTGSIRTATLAMLVCVVLIVALLMVAELVRFALHPDPAVKAGPMYVILTLATIAAMLMLVLALNASFLPFMSRQRAANMGLVMWAMGLTAVVTGVLTVGQAAGSMVARFCIGGLAFVFITRQNARLARVRATAPADPVGPPAKPTQVRPRGRQRRGGRQR
jgi:hypothetical protein